MLKWFSEKAIDARIWACSKEVLWDLESSDSVRRAQILTLMTLMRWEFMRSGGISALPLDMVIFTPRDLLTAKYEGLEDARNATADHGGKVVSQLKAQGNPASRAFDEHLLKLRRTSEVLMISIGVGINQAIKEQVQKVWDLLLASQADIDDAVVRLREFEDLSNLISPNSSTNTFRELDIEFIKEECGYRPVGL